MKLPVFYGSYRSDRLGIRLADYAIAKLKARGHEAPLIDAKAVGLPILDRMYKEYPKAEAPAAMEQVADVLRGADGFVFVAGEYNWGVQPGLKNLTDHFLEEWFWRPAAILSYSTTRTGGARAGAAWHAIVSEMGMAPAGTLAVTDIAHTLDDQAQPLGAGGAGLEKSFAKAADTLEWWAHAARDARAVRKPPY